MKYKANIFRATWEIVGSDGHTRVCQGPLPYDMRSGINLDAAIRNGLQANNDTEVLEIMQLWRK